MDPDPRIHLLGIVDPDLGPEWDLIRVPEFDYECLSFSLRETTCKVVIHIQKYIIILGSKQKHM